MKTLLRYTLPLALAFTALAAWADTSGKYLLTLTAQDGKSMVVALTATGDHFSLGQKYAPNPANMDVTDSTLDGTKVRATITFTLGEATYRCDLDAVSEKDAISGKFDGRWGDQNVSGTIAGRRIPLGYMGYRGDGSGLAPDANPPTSWDVAAKRNVRWSVPLPNWGDSSPIVAGNRVFVTSESDSTHDFPLLLCLSVTDGSVLWQKELDPIPAMKLPDDQAKALRDEWHTLMLSRRTVTALQERVDAATDKAAAKQVMEKVLSDQHLTWPPDAAVLKDVIAHGLVFFIDKGLIGYTTPTPVTDGTRVFVATANQFFACYDLDGNLQWQSVFPAPPAARAAKGTADIHPFTRSPLLYRDLLISDIGGRIRAIDTATGALRWSHDESVGFETTSVSPVIITVGGTDVLLAGSGYPIIWAFRLPDGMPLIMDKWSYTVGDMLVKSDEPDVVFFTLAVDNGWSFPDSRSPVVVRFTLQKDTLQGTVLWGAQPDEGDLLLAAAPVAPRGVVYADGNLFTPTGQVFDAATGDKVTGAAAPLSDAQLWAAGGRVFGVSETRVAGKPTVGTVQVYDTNGAIQAENILPVPTPASDHATLIEETVGSTDWGFSSECPFAVAGNALYVRSNDMLFCLSRVK